MDERIRQVCWDIARSSRNISREELEKDQSQRGYEEQEEKKQ